MCPIERIIAFVCVISIEGRVDWQEFDESIDKFKPDFDGAKNTHAIRVAFQETVANEIYLYHVTNTTKVEPKLGIHQPIYACNSNNRLYFP